MLVLNTHVLQEGCHPQDRHRKPALLKRSHLVTAVFLSLLTQSHRWPPIHLLLSHKIIHSKPRLPYRRTARQGFEHHKVQPDLIIRRKVGSKLSSPELAKEGHKHKYTAKNRTKLSSQAHLFTPKLSQQRMKAAASWVREKSSHHTPRGGGEHALVGHETNGVRPAELNRAPSFQWWLKSDQGNCIGCDNAHKSSEEGRTSAGVCLRSKEPRRLFSQHGELRTKLGCVSGVTQG